MPILCRLDGTAIRINTRDHLPPHFHARYGDAEIRIDITTFTVMTGSLPAARQRKLLRWAAAHQDELVRNWERAQQGLGPELISPKVPRRSV